MDQSVTSVSEAITGKDEETFTHLLGMFDHDDDGKLTFDELVDIKKALDTLTSFAEKGPKGIKPSLPLPDLIKSGGVIELETKRLEEKNGDKGVQITYGMFEDRCGKIAIVSHYRQDVVRSAQCPLSVAGALRSYRRITFISAHYVHSRIRSYRRFGGVQILAGASRHWCRIQETRWQ
ncbi:hypothetical protein OAN61_00160 [bacterium]|nr:hypothetical protein [bacterium]